MKIINPILLTLASAILSETTSDKRLIKLSEESPAKWMSDQEVLTQLLQKNVHFMDITDVGEPNSRLAPPSAQALPTAARYQAIVSPLLPNININRMKSFLTTYSNFNNRYYQSQTGVQASNWLQSQIQDSINASGYAGSVKVEAITHSFAQKSIIVRIEGKDAILKDEIVVVGAHLDSINQSDPMNGRAPGADDDGSGTTCNLEALRVLLSSKFQPKRTIEFQFYAGEERGLLGSQDIAKAYSNAKKNVIAMTQFDMVGYLSNQKKIGLVTDYTNAELTSLLQKLITQYLSYGYINKKCGYACSDHASWNKYGYKSAFPFEDQSNPNIHTTRDTLDYVNFNHINEFVKLALSFLVEVAEPSN